MQERTSGRSLLRRLQRLHNSFDSVRSVDSPHPGLKLLLQIEKVTFNLEGGLTEPAVDWGLVEEERR
jgi:hypothetical protein